MRTYTAPTTTRNGKDKQISRFIAEAALGRTLKTNEEVHHIDENPYNNSKDNLIVCTKEYHHYLHIRMKAWKGCGNANYRKCVYCKKWDDPIHMTRRLSGNSGKYWHSQCHKDACRMRYKGLIGRKALLKGTK